MTILTPLKTNFMTVILGIIGGILIYYLVFRKRKHTSQPPNISKPKPVKQKVLVPKKEDFSKNLFYKNKSIRVFEIKGIGYIKPDKLDDTSVAYVQCEDNSQDKYAVAVFNGNGVKLGYAPKGNIRLHNSLKEWYAGKVYAWGHIENSEFYRKWIGTVYIPVKFSPEEIDKIKEFHSLSSLNDRAITQKDKSTEEYFKILERHNRIKDILIELKHPQELYYSFSKNLIPSLSKHLEKQKEWDRLIELESYEELINELSDIFRGATEKRIELAKSKI